MTGQLYLGAISGTSVDGLDLALLATDPAPGIVAATTVPLPEALQRALLALGQLDAEDIDALGRADRDLGLFIGEAVNDFLRAVNRPAAGITAIGSHGQTVRHRPDGDAPFTMQIGDPNQIAEVTGITTVADFRRRDMAAGGQGAPLVPPFHAALFRTSGENRAVLNIGGIANLTLLPADTAASISGFDTGPGNCLMDAWILRRRQQRFDRDGAWAISGTVDEEFLKLLLQDAYLHKPPPKSTGREYFNLPWLTRVGPRLPKEDADVQATLCAFTAETVAQALRRWAPSTDHLLVCGGGRLNGTLMRGLSQRTGLRVTSTDAYGIDGDGLEAAAFAWLAQQALKGLPGNEPAVTGARGYRVLGSIYPGQQR